MKLIEFFPYLLYNKYTRRYFYINTRVSAEKERKSEMKQEKLVYEAVALEVTRFGTEDIVTASVADNFDYVDQDAWDS